MSRKQPLAELPRRAHNDCMSNTVLRDVQPDDNAALLGLERKSPQGTTLKMHSERRDYLYRARLFGNHRTTVAVDNGKVFGVLGATMKTVRLAGDDVRVAMFYDLRLDPDYRTSLLGRHMLRNWLEMEKWAEAEGARIIYGMVKADNTPMLVMQRHKDGYRLAGRMVVLSRAVYRRRRVREQPEEVDLTEYNREMAEAVAAEYGELALFPADLRAAYLTEPMRETGLFSCYRLRRGDSWASIGLYRVSREIWTRVVELPWYYRAARPVIETIRPVLALPVIPREGDQVLYHHLFNHLAHGPQGMTLWSEIVRYLNNVALDEGATLMTGMFDPSDRFFDAYRRGALNRIDYEIGYRPLEADATYSFSPFAPDVRDMD